MNMNTDIAKSLFQLMGMDEGVEDVNNESGEEGASNPKLHESPRYQEAVELFIDRNGQEPATDDDFEGPGGVLEIMEELKNGKPRSSTEEAVINKLDEEDEEDEY